MASAKGSRLISQTTNATYEAEGGVTTHGISGPPASGGNITASYPRGGLTGRDPRDERVAEKMQFVQAGRTAGGVQGQTAFGQVVASDADFDWLAKKRETEAAANFDAWVGSNFHTNDVVKRKWLQEVYPDYYEAREQLMIDRAKFALRVHLLKLRGVANEKDLVLAWGLQTGRIKLDDGWDKIGYNTAFNAATERARFADGLFSVKRFLSDSERAANAGATNGNPQQNPFGGPNAQVPTTFFGGTVPTTNRYPSFLSNVVQPYVN